MTTRSQAFTANLGSLSVKEGMVSFRLRILEEPNKAELYNLTLLQQKEIRAVLEPVEGSSESIDMDGNKNKKSESYKNRSISNSALTPI